MFVFVKIKKGLKKVNINNKNSIYSVLRLEYRVVRL